MTLIQIPIMMKFHLLQPNFNIDLETKSPTLNESSNQQNEHHPSGWSMIARNVTIIYGEKGYANITWGAPLEVVINVVELMQNQPCTIQSRNTTSRKSWAKMLRDKLNFLHADSPLKDSNSIGFEVQMYGSWFHSEYHTIILQYTISKLL